MKNKSFFRTVFLTGMLGLLVSNVNAQSNVRVLSASDVTCIGSGTCLNWTNSESGDPANCIGGGFWNQTYGNNGGFGIGSFKLSHNSGWDIYSYWGGFTSGSNGDNLCYSTNCTANVSPCAQSGSNGWIYNQWGVMAGGGLSSTSPITTTQGVPYLIAYWDYFSDGIDPNAKSLQIKLNGDSLFTLNEMYICNHPWPYYGNIYGDGFARPFHSGDHFDLIVHGVKSNGTEVTKIISLANYNGTLSQSSIWELITFTPSATWNNLKSIYFTMTSTDELVIDNTNYGPNTAVYFCLDKVKVTKSGTVAPVSSTAQKVKAVELKTVEVKDVFPVPSYAGGDVIVFNVEGKEVFKTNVRAGEKINLSNLPVGEYRLQHGHKLIPIKKGNKK